MQLPSSLHVLVFWRHSILYTYNSLPLKTTANFLIFSMPLSTNSVSYFFFDWLQGCFRSFGDRLVFIRAHRFELDHIPGLSLNGPPGSGITGYNHDTVPAVTGLPVRSLCRGKFEEALELYMDTGTGQTNFLATP